MNQQDPINTQLMMYYYIIIHFHNGNCPFHLFKDIYICMVHFKSNYLMSNNLS